MKKLALVLLALVFSPSAPAVIVHGVSVDELYAESAIVVSGVIESGKVLPDECGVAYEVRIDQRYKGDASPGDLLVFEKYGPMQVGARYFLFLGTTSEEFRPILSTNSGAMNRRAEYLERCGGNRPPYVVNIWGNGALKVTGTYHATLKEAEVVVFDDYLVKPGEDLDVTKLADGDRYDNDRHDAAVEVQGFSDHLRVLAGG